MTGEKRTVALIGAKGMLAQMIKASASQELQLHEYDLPSFDLTDAAMVRKEMGALGPDAIINCAAYTNVDGCESEEALATKVNGDGPGHLAAVAKDLGATLVHISTDYVFPGHGTRPYREDDATGPLSAYGRSKLAGEEAILKSGLEKYFIIRTSWLYGPWGKNFVETILRLAGEREELSIVADQFGSPTYTGDLARAVFNLLEADVEQSPYGIYHLSNEGQCSWYDFACEIVKFAREESLPVKAERIEPIGTEEFPLPAQRPAYSVFDKSKYRRATGAKVPEWQESLATYFRCR